VDYLHPPEKYDQVYSRGTKASETEENSFCWKHHTVVELLSIHQIVQPVVRAAEAAKQLVFLFLRAAAEQKIHVSRRGEYIFYRFRSKIC
jgi:hypothetical protein